MTTMWARFLAAMPAFLLLLCFSTPDAAAERKDKGPVAIKLGDTVVTHDELNDRFRVAVRLLARKQGVSLSAQDSAVIERLREQYLDKYATELVMLREADRRNVTVSAAEVDAAVAEISAATDSHGNLLEGLNDAGIDGEKQLRQIVQDEKMVELLTELMLREIVVPPGDVVTFHHDMKDRLATPEQVCVRHIQSDTPEAAKEILEELGRGAEFNELATERSTDRSSAGSGGDLGCFEKGHSAARTEFEKAAFAAQEGELVGPVASEFGYHVIEVYERKPPHVPTLNEAYNEIARELAREQLPQRISTLVNESGMQTYPEISGAGTVRE